MSATGVYLPCLDLGVHCYKECMNDFKKLINESWLLGPVTVLVDFNAHLEGWECQRSMQGMMLREILGRCELSSVLEGVLAFGQNTITTVAI